MMTDPFKDGYSLSQLSQAINILPNMYGRVNAMNLFPFKGQTGRTVIIEMKDGILRLVKTSDWGAPAPKNQMGKRRVKSFVVPHMPLEDTVNAADVMGIRQFGTENTLETVASRVNEKLQSMKDKIDQTMEWRKMSALQGIVLDADGSVLYNYFEEFGITPAVVPFVLGTATTEVRQKTFDVARIIEDNLMGETSTGVQVLASRTWFDAFVKHATVKAAFANYAEAAQRLGGDVRKGFRFGAFMVEEYHALVDGRLFIPEGKAYAFPMGTSETFSNFGAPADFNETVNTVALPFYARQKNTDFNRGIDLHVQANQLPMVTRPGTLVELGL